MRNFNFLLLVFCLLTVPVTTSAQVTIGSDKTPENFSLLELVSNGSGALRLPQLTLDERKALNLSGNKLAKGLTIFNTTAGCAEYWNGTKWVSLCSGTSELSLSKNNNNCASFDAGGNCVNSYTVSDPNYKEQGEYFLSWISGESYIEQLNVEQRGDAVLFTVKFLPNDRASDRTSILMVTSPFGNSNLFIYTQLGNQTDCGNTASVPKIKAENDKTSFCSGGAVYLYLDGRPGGSYIWTLNGQEIGSGTELVATQAGKYIVYANKIGCTTYKPDTLLVTTSSNEISPAPLSVICANEGFVCSESETTKLYATISGAGTVRWYKNGVRQGLTGSPVNAGIGEWFAVVEDGDCSSMPSNTITVRVELYSTGQVITVPVILINGVASEPNGNSLCTGGSLPLAVATPQKGVTYTWYKDNTLIGQGTSIEYSLSGTSGSFLLRCRATTGFSCSKEAISNATVTTAVAPGMPSISINPASGVLCGGQATLTASSTGATSYRWFKDNVQLPETSNMLTITETASYTVKGVNGTCISLVSAPKVVSSASGLAEVTISGQQTANPGDTRTYTAMMNNPQGAAYNWTVGGVGSLVSGQRSNQITVYFASAGAATIGLTAANDCGTASVTNNNYAVTVATTCTNASITAYNPVSKTQTIIAGQQTTLGITAAGSPTLSYKWFKSATAQTTGGTEVGSGASYSTPNTLATGTHYYYCVVTSSCNNSTAISEVFTVTVNSDPSTLPAGTSTSTVTGKYLFDVAITDYTSGSSCGTLSSRIGQKADFSQTATNTQVYTFTSLDAYSNVRFYAVENNHQGQIVESITPNGNQATVVYKNVNTLATGKDKSSALSVTIYVVYTDNSQTDVQLSFDVKIMDCQFCPGYLAVGGEYATSKTDYLAIPEKTTFAELTDSSGSWKFAKTGKDLCFYKTDGNNSTTTNWSTTKRSCESANTNYNDGTFGWRLPNIAELGAIQSVHNSLASQSTSATDTANLHSNSYWSSTEYNGATAMVWYFSSGFTIRYNKMSIVYVRCVKGY
ncbi:MAG: DUF1566 domain-containing protein [Dysgonamonadaceae bacterium]|jgi:hypothetical protein|nr:DUF1566 domain-containing protein [Dysgonamonadaceae bacterium]